MAVGDDGFRTITKDRAGMMREFNSEARPPLQNSRSVAAGALRQFRSWSLIKPCVAVIGSASSLAQQ